MTELPRLIDRLKETFDPGGMLPEDCSEWAAEHDQAIEDVSARLQQLEARVHQLSEECGVSELRLQQLAQEKARLEAELAVAKHHKVLSLLGKSSWQAVVEDKLRIELAESQVANDQLRAALAETRAALQSLQDELVLHDRSFPEGFASRWLDAVRTMLARVDSPGATSDASVPQGQPRGNP